MTLSIIRPIKGFFPEKTRCLVFMEICFKALFSAISQQAGMSHIRLAILINLRCPPWMPEHPAGKEEKTERI